MEINKKTLKKYIINISVLTSTIVLIVANMYTEYIDKILKDIIAPLFSIDLDNNGVPDLQQLKNYHITVRNVKFPLGNLIYNLSILVIKIFILYLITVYLLKKIKMN